MREPTRVGIREIRMRLGEYVDNAHFLKQPTTITKNGKDVAFIGPHEWLAELDAYRARYGPLEPGR